MREILFRGKCVEVGIYYKRWLEGFYGEDDGKALIAHNTDLGMVGYVCDPDTIGQYTGLKDENGTRIFEGDIIKCGKYLLLVEWEDCTGYHPFNHYGCTADECEVIGNIYDNPELM